MGCVCSDMVTKDRCEEPLNEESVIKQYSWDKRESIRLKDSVVSSIQNLSDSTSTRLPGTCPGHQIVIQKCQNSSIYLFDYLASVLVENCDDCLMFLGPTETSITLTNCRNCKVILACQQLVVKSSSDLQLFLLCATQPLIDTCLRIHFNCFQFYYPQLEDHLQRAQLSCYNNFWNCVYNISSSSTSSSSSSPPPKHRDNDKFVISDKRPDIEGVFGLPDDWQQVGVKLGSEHTIVPYMPSLKALPSDQSCLIMFFNDGLSHDRARTFIVLIDKNHPECSLVQGREMLLRQEESSEIFNSDKYATAIKQGPVIGLEYQGDSCRHFCQETLVTVSKGSTGLVFISNARQLCQRQVEAFRRFADIKLGCMKTPEAYKKKLG